MLGCGKGLVGSVLPAVVLTQCWASGYGARGAADMVRHFMAMVLGGRSHGVTKHWAQDELTSMSPKLRERAACRVSSCCLCIHALAGMTAGIRDIWPENK